MIELGLSRISRLLSRTPFPWRAIHVAGTNGKGSICAYISAMLEAYNAFEPQSSARPCKITHARFTSPHLIDRHDCISIDGGTINIDVFQRIERDVLQKDSELGIQATEFEVLTATAFKAFTEAKVDVGVVEVGIGGRLDATNILGQPVPDERGPQAGKTETVSRPAPLVTGIASISMDHQALLGDTITDIAREKAGIVKSAVPVPYASENDAVSAVIEQHARNVEAGPIVPTTASTTIAEVWRAWESNDYNHDGPDQSISKNVANGAIALHSTWSALRQMGRLAEVSIDDRLRLFNVLAKVPDRVKWPGRLELRSLAPLTGRNNPVVIDGAHNEQSARLLDDFINGISQSQNKARRRRHLIAAFSKGKDISGMLAAMVRPGDVLTAVEFGPVEGMPWVQPESRETIIDTCRNVWGKEVQIVQPRAGATQLRATLQDVAASAFSKDCQLVVAGSLYLVGDVLRLLRDHERDNKPS